MKTFFLSCILSLFFLTAQAASYKVDEVHVYKSKRLMNMLYQGEVTKQYKVMLGKGGLGKKVKEGDNKVPEGTYLLDFKNPYSKYYKSIKISYPSEDDIRRSEELGVDPGKDIFIHGKPKLGKFLKGDWTRGCIAVENYEMQEIWENVEVPTPITIYP